MATSFCLSSRDIKRPLCQRCEQEINLVDKIVVDRLTSIILQNYLLTQSLFKQLLDSLVCNLQKFFFLSNDLLTWFSNVQWDMHIWTFQSYIWNENIWKIFGTTSFKNNGKFPNMGKNCQVKNVSIV